MERGSKRKATLAISPSVERSAKRQKTPVPEADPQSSTIPNAAGPQEVQDAALRYVARARDAKDKEDNLIAIDFLTLPSRSAFPDYYLHTPLPIALDTIEQNARNAQYPSVSSVESDAKRMIQNAKDYNEPGSIIHANAERLRKITFNFMKQFNPAYTLDKNYVSQPTPIPTAGGEDQHKAQTKIRLKSTRDVNPPNVTSDESKPTAAVAPNDEVVLNPEEDGYDESFEGKSYQQAQEQIALELIKYRDEGGDLYIFQPFVNLPSRKLVEYYRVIKEPLSLTQVWKKVKGMTGARGHEEISNQTEFRTWDAFENEVRRVWENARTYNEEGSEIDEISHELENYFRERLAEAKKVVSEPPPPTLKLKISKPPASLKLRLGSQKASPAPAVPAPSSRLRASATPGVSIDAAALQRQKAAVTAGVNGQTQSSDSVVPRPPSSSGALATAPNMNGVKAESHASSPAVTDQQARPPSQQTSMPAPPRTVNGISHAVSNPYNHTTYAHSSSNGFDNKFRQEGKDASTALLSNLQIITHPSLQLPPSQSHINISIPASDTLTQQNITLNLLPSQTHLQLYPSISHDLAFNRNRPHRLFVTCNGQRLNGSAARAPENTGNGGGPIANGTVPNGANANSNANSNVMPKGPPSNAYDVRLAAGMNRIEVECVAVAEGALGAGTLAGKGGLEMERFCAFVHLLRG